MNTATTVIWMLVRLTGLVQIILGILFWTGNALTLIPVHLLNGSVFVLLLWALAILAALAGVSARLVALAIVWGFVVPILGITQTQLLPGDYHWGIQVLHLLVGLGAIGLAGRLARRMRGAPASSTAAPAGGRSACLLRGAAATGAHARSRPSSSRAPV